MRVATPDVVEAVLSLYIPGLTHTYFLDGEGEAVQHALTTPYSIIGCPLPKPHIDSLANG